MDRLEDLLKGASRGEIAYLARKAAAVLAVLPAVHAELGRKGHAELPAVLEMVRLLGALETVTLSLAFRDRDALANSARNAAHAASS